MTRDELENGFMLAGFEVRPLEGRVIGPAGERHLRPKSADVLLCLSDHAPELVTRDRLLTTVWGENAVSDESMTRCIGDLRKAFRKLGADDDFIETVPKRGYRLTVMPRHLDSGDSAVRHSGRRSRPKRGRLAYPWTLALFGVIAVLFLLFFVPRYPGTPVDNETTGAIAVLPLKSLNNDEETQFFADGLVEDLLGRLAAVEGLQVISRTSSETLKNLDAQSMSSVADLLGASWVVEGSVQRQGERIRVHAKLVDAREDRQLWSEQFDGELADIFEVQSEIAVDIASALRQLLSDQEARRLRTNRTENVAAFEAYHLGRFQWNLRTGEGYSRSIGHFQRAIALDPAYGLAYAGLADTYNLMAIQGYIEQEEGRSLALELSRRALELDPTLAEAHIAMASIYTYLDFAWEEAEAHYRAALELNPNYSTAHHYYSEHLSITGDHAAGRRHIDTALALDPLSFVIRTVSAKLFFHRGEFAAAAEDIERAREVYRDQDHHWLARWDFRLAHAQGDEDAALDGFKRMYSDYERWLERDEIDRIYEASGFDGLLGRLVEKSDSPMDRATFEAMRGNTERALSELEAAWQQGRLNPEFSFFLEFQPMHGHPRFIALLEHVGLDHRSQ